MTSAVDMSYLKERKWDPNYSWGKDLTDKFCSTCVWIIRGLIILAIISYLI